MEYRIRFETKDGCLIMNRLTHDWVFEDDEFIIITTNRNAVEHGVKILSRSKDCETGIIKAIVDYL